MALKTASRWLAPHLPGQRGRRRDRQRLARAGAARTARRRWPEQGRAADRHRPPTRAVGQAAPRGRRGACGRRRHDRRSAGPEPVNPGAEAWTHTTVLLHEAVEALVHAPDGIYVDGTFGRGGHARAILDRLSPQGRLMAFDKDPQAIAAGAALAAMRGCSCCMPASPACTSAGAARHRAGAGRAARPGRQLAADRRPGARLQLPLRRAAGHAHGHDPRRDGRGLSGPRR